MSSRIYNEYIPTPDAPITLLWLDSIGKRFKKGMIHLGAWGRWEGVGRGGIYIEESGIGEEWRNRYLEKNRGQVYKFALVCEGMVNGDKPPWRWQE